MNKNTLDCYNLFLQSYLSGAQPFLNPNLSACLKWLNAFRHWQTNSNPKTQEILIQSLVAWVYVARVQMGQSIQHSWCKKLWPMLVLFWISDQRQFNAWLSPLHSTDKLNALSQLVNWALELCKLDPDYLMHQAVGQCPVLNVDLAQPTNAVPAWAKMFLQGVPAQLIAPALLEFWQHNSGGVFSQFSVFEWQNNILSPVQHNNPTQFEDFFGLEHQHQQLKKNTQAFLKEGRGQHTLLWGERGTGKSSSVLALLNHFKHQGLKLVEIQPKDLTTWPFLCKQLSILPEKFLLFCDDLSFTRENPAYKTLQAWLEGSVSALSPNCLLHVTANRRDLVDKGEYIDEQRIEKKQLLDELRAVDDRFGLKLFFGAPRFDKLKNLLLTMARQLGLKYEPAKLFKAFQQFCRTNQLDQPSARAIQQFLKTKM